MAILAFIIPLYLLAIYLIYDTLKPTRTLAQVKGITLETWLAVFKGFGIYLSQETFTAKPDYSDPKTYTNYMVIDRSYKVSKNSGVYYVELGAGIEPMCGTAWLDEHWSDLKDYKPEMSISIPGYTNTFKLNDLNKAKQVIQASISKGMVKAIDEKDYETIKVKGYDGKIHKERRLKTTNTPAEVKTENNTLRELRLATA